MEGKRDTDNSIKTANRRVLVVSYNSFSKEGANGRTLESLFFKWERGKLAQFFMMDERPDFDVCGTYARITDAQALGSFVTRKDVRGFVVHDAPSARPSQTGGAKGCFQRLAAFAKAHKSSTIIKLIRNIVWKSRAWKSAELEQWIDAFGPELVFTMSGKNEYLHNIALEIASKRKLPLIVYHCEDYYFKNLHPFSPFYFLYRRGLRRSLKRLMSYASCAIYNSESIKALYEKEFGIPGHVIYMTTAVENAGAKPSDFSGRIVVSYLGNIRNKRYIPLSRLANALERAAPKAVLNIYCEPLSAKQKKLFGRCKNIVYKGFVPYEECLEAIANSDLLVHAESFDKKTARDLRIAFSTKIADSLACGKCFLVYAPEGIAFVDYLKKTGSAFIVTHPEELEDAVLQIIGNAGLRQRTIQKALAAVEANHRPQASAGRFARIVGDVCRV